MAKYKQIKEIPSEKGDGDVTICNIRLLEDNESGDRVIQVRLKNNSAEAQVAFAVLRVECFDAQGNESEPNILERFGCDVGLGEYFGVKHPIRLKNKITDNVFVSVDTIEFKYDESDNDPIPAETECVPDEEEEENSVSEEADEAVYETSIEAEELDDDIDEEQDTISDEAQDNSPAEQLPTAKETPAKVKNYSKYILAGTAAFVLICIGAGLSTGNRKTDIDKANVTVSETTEVSETTSQVRETEATTSKPVTTHSETTAVTEAEINTDELPFEKGYSDPPPSIIGKRVPIIDAECRVVEYIEQSELCHYSYNDSVFCSVGVIYPNFLVVDGMDPYYPNLLNAICKELCSRVNVDDPDQYAADVFETGYLTGSGDCHYIYGEFATKKFAVFNDTNWHQEPGGFSLGSKDYYVYDMNDKHIIDIDDLFVIYGRELLANDIIWQIEQNPYEYYDNATEYVMNYLDSENLSWCINKDGGITVCFPEQYISANGYSEFDIPYLYIKDYLSDYGRELIDSLMISFNNGNTIGNIMNYSAYTTDGMNLYFAGGKDGYDWRLSKSADKYLTNSERINQDYTDWVLYYEGWIYYRTASDDNCLYKIKPDGSGKTKLTDSKTARINIDNGKLYFRQDGAFYEMNTDGTGKRMLVNEPCYGSFVTDGKLYYLSSDSTYIIQYDISSGIINWLYPNYSGFEIKYFTVDAKNGYIYSTADDYNGNSAFCGYNMKTGIMESYYSEGFKVYSFNLDDEFIYLASSMDGQYSLVKISINNMEYNQSYDGPVIQREFYIIGDMIYYFDKDGAVYKMAKPV